VNEDLGPGARVAVELSAESARSMVETILAVLEQAEAGGHLSDSQLLGRNLTYSSQTRSLMKINVKIRSIVNITMGC
jgi:hypothetical protein